LLVLGIIASFSIAAFSYYETKNRIFEDAIRKAELMSSFAMASRKYAVNTMRPMTMKIAEKGSFYPELMGGFFVARAISDLFASAQPGYSFKQAALDPINANNLATLEEVEIIKYLAENRNVKAKKGIMEKNGQKYFYVAHPVVVKKDCLKCHDSKKNAIEGRVLRYPGPGGYNYKVNDVVATFINYIPLQKALDDLKSTAIKTILVGIGSILFILVVIWFFMNSVITGPILKITKIAEDMSKGKSLDVDVTSKQKDEIGALYDSFNRMRKSVALLIKMAQQKK
jgi:protein-histidine pros-kinase